MNEALAEIRREYSGSAEVTIFGQLDHRILQGMLGKHTDGIGFFKLLPQLAGC